MGLGEREGGIACIIVVGGDVVGVDVEVGVAETMEVVLVGVMVVVVVE